MTINRNRLCCGKLETSSYALGPVTSVGTDQAKFEKNLIYRAIWLGFLCSLVSAMRSKANKSIRQREERPIGSCAIKMLRDLLRLAHSLAQHVAVAKARTKVRAPGEYDVNNCSTQ